MTKWKSGQATSCIGGIKSSSEGKSFHLFSISQNCGFCNSMAQLCAHHLRCRVLESFQDRLQEPSKAFRINMIFT